MTDIRETYSSRFDTLKAVAAKIRADLEISLAELDHIDRIFVRPKSIESFLTKAAKAENSIPKYQDPINEIQDQVGARIITFYLDDVEKITNRLLAYYKRIEEKDIVPESEKEFGYFGKHFILLLPKDLKPEGAAEELLPSVFELQIKTLFQHAFSEGSHDLAYKPVSPLSKEQQRKVAFIAAQAWGGDTIFQDLHNELFPTLQAQP